MQAKQLTVQAKRQDKNTDSTSQATVQEQSQSTVQEHNQQVSRQYKLSNSTRTQSAGQQTVQAKQLYKRTISRSVDLQAKQQYKNTVSRSADSTGQATVQKYKDQLQLANTSVPPPKLEHACSNISPGWKSGKHNWKVAGLHIISLYTEFSPPVAQIKNFCSDPGFFLSPFDDVCQGSHWLFQSLLC